MAFFMKDVNNMTEHDKTKPSLKYKLTINPLVFISLLIGNQFTSNVSETTLEQMKSQAIVIWELKEEAKERFQESFLDFESKVYDLIWQSLTIEHFLASEAFEFEYVEEHQMMVKDQVLFSLNRRFGFTNFSAAFTYSLSQCAEAVYDKCLNDDELKQKTIDFWSVVEEGINEGLNRLVHGEAPNF
jgi:hypothetical protein